LNGFFERRGGLLILELAEIDRPHVVVGLGIPGSPPAELEVFLLCQRQVSVLDRSTGLAVELLGGGLRLRTQGAPGEPGDKL
jgi:hypothetical protein